MPESQSPQRTLAVDTLKPGLGVSGAPPRTPSRRLNGGAPQRTPSRRFNGGAPQNAGPFPSATPGGEKRRRQFSKTIPRAITRFGGRRPTRSSGGKDGDGDTTPPRTPQPLPTSALTRDEEERLRRAHAKRGGELHDVPRIASLVGKLSLSCDGDPQQLEGDLAAVGWTPQYGTQGNQLCWEQFRRLAALRKARLNRELARLEDEKDARAAFEALLQSQGLAAADVSQDAQQCGAVPVTAVAGLLGGFGLPQPMALQEALNSAVPGGAKGVDFQGFWSALNDMKETPRPDPQEISRDAEASADNHSLPGFGSRAFGSRHLSLSAASMVSEGSAPRERSSFRQGGIRAYTTRSLEDTMDSTHESAPPTSKSEHPSHRVWAPQHQTGPRTVPATPDLTPAGSRHTLVPSRGSPGSPQSGTPALAVVQPPAPAVPHPHPNAARGPRQIISLRSKAAQSQFPDEPEVQRTASGVSTLPQTPTASAQVPPPISVAQDGPTPNSSPKATTPRAGSPRPNVADSAARLSLQGYQSPVSSLDPRARVPSTMLSMRGNPSPMLHTLLTSGVSPSKMKLSTGHLPPPEPAPSCVDGHRAKLETKWEAHWQRMVSVAMSTMEPGAAKGLREYLGAVLKTEAAEQRDPKLRYAYHRRLRRMREHRRLNRAPQGHIVSCRDGELTAVATLAGARLPEQQRQKQSWAPACLREWQDTTLGLAWDVGDERITRHIDRVVSQVFAAAHAECDMAADAQAKPGSSPRARSPRLRKSHTFTAAQGRLKVKEMQRQRALEELSFAHVPEETPRPAADPVRAVWRAGRLRRKELARRGRERRKERDATAAKPDTSLLSGPETDPRPQFTASVKLQMRSRPLRRQSRTPDVQRRWRPLSLTLAADSAATAADVVLGPAPGSGGQDGDEREPEAAEDVPSAPEASTVPEAATDWWDPAVPRDHRVIEFDDVSD